MSVGVQEPADATWDDAPRAVEQRKRRVLVRMLLLLAVVGFWGVVALTLAEVGIRVVAPQQLIVARPDVWVPVDVLGHQKPPNIATELNVGPRPVHFFTDSLGFRVGAEGRTAGKKRVLILGDSFMEAREVEYEESVPGLLEAALAQDLGYPVEVWNTGVSDWGPSHYLLQAKQLFDKYEFDVMLLAIFVGNDVLPKRVDYFPPRAPRMRHSFRIPRRLTASAFVEGLLYPLNDFLEERSHLFLFAKYRLRTLLMGFGLTADYFPYSLLRREADSSSWEVTADICKEIVDLAAAHGLETVVVIIPAIQQIDWSVAQVFLENFDVDSTGVDIDQPNRILGEKFRERRLEVIDALPEFRRQYQEGVTLYETVGWHLELDGHRVLTQLIEPALLRHLEDAEN
jgi:hypothetical protein